MRRWTTSFGAALSNPLAQAVLAAALLVPLVAGAGQYWASGFWQRSAGVAVLFWPGAAWRWVVTLPVWLTMGAMMASYVAGIAWLARARALGKVVLCGLGVMVAASLSARALNTFTGWRELQSVSSLAAPGMADRIIFAHWHNPAWEELVFRGIPLVLLHLATRSGRAARPWVTWAYYLVPAVVTAVYHVPGHGPSRLLDSFIISIVFSWLAVRYSFFAPLVLHYAFDAISTLSMGRMRGLPAEEVAWLARHFTVLNSTWSLLMLAWMASVLTVAVFHRFGARFRLTLAGAKG